MPPMRSVSKVMWDLILLLAVLSMSPEVLEVDEDESKRVLDRGYMSVVGSLLWPAQRYHPEILFATSQLGRVMSKPSELAWTCAMHTLQWMIQHKNRGIRFSNNRSHVPTAHCDASNKKDLQDSLVQGGGVIRWMGGPVIAWSCKLKHTSKSVRGGCCKYCTPKYQMIARE